MTSDKRLRSLIEKVSNVLEEGQCIAIIGWKDSNHSDYTKKLHTNTVRFYHRLPRALPDKVGLLLATRFVKHTEIKAAKKHTTVHPVAITIGSIKKILQECEANTFPKRIAKEATTGVQPVADPISTREVEAIVPQPELHVPPEKETPHQIFAKAFFNKIQNDIEKRLSKYVVNTLIRECFPNKVSATKLTQEGWLESVIKEGGQKVGSYKAGPRMLEIATKPEPTDPIERARWLLSQEKELVAERNRLATEHSIIVSKLEKIEEAKKLLLELESLMK